MALRGRADGALDQGAVIQAIPGKAEEGASLVWLATDDNAARGSLGAASPAVLSARPLGTAGHQSISAWRDYDETIAALRDSMSMGTWALTPGGCLSADELFAAGARRVRFHEVVDTGSADAAGTVRALTLIRDLTACGVVVGWELRLGADQDWRELSHLYPPASITTDGGPGGADPRAEWATEYLMTKCVTRRGPGLLEIRDRRFGALRKITVDRPDYLAAIAALEYGAPADYVPPGILRELRAQRLVGPARGMAWWLPYRVRRYAFTSRLM